jgi:hypothetical protein
MPRHRAVVFVFELILQLGTFVLGPLWFAWLFHLNAHTPQHPYYNPETENSHLVCLANQCPRCMQRVVVGAP